MRILRRTFQYNLNGTRFMQLKNKLHVLIDLPHKLFRQFGISCRKINCWPTVPGEVKAFFYMFGRRRALGWL